MKYTNLKITGGELRGREIKSPENVNTRPMGSRERLALMNAIGPEIKDKIILDVFSGTGALGIEALSRGAKHVTFIEKNHQTAEVLRQNLKHLKLQDKTRVFESDIAKIDFDSRFDLVIADPPYNQIFRIGPLIFNKLINLSKIKFILSHPDSFDPHVLNAQLLSTKAYASARISTFIK